jgi:hypothetical protein
MSRSARSSPPPVYSLDKDGAKQAVMGMVTVSSRPLLIGVAALRLGSFWSLDRTQELFHELEDEGLLRRITPEEMRGLGMTEGWLLAGVTPKRAV